MWSCGWFFLSQPTNLLSSQNNHDQKRNSSHGNWQRGRDSTKNMTLELRPETRAKPGAREQEPLDTTTLFPIDSHLSLLGFLFTSIKETKRWPMSSIHHPCTWSQQAPWWRLTFLTVEEIPQEKSFFWWEVFFLSETSRVKE